MKRFMFTLLLATIFGSITGIISFFVTDWQYAPIVGGMFAGTFSFFTSGYLYDKLFVNKRKKVLSVLQEMGEED